MAMALSAGPEHLRAAASVYVLKKDGFVLARQGTNGFTCIVNRDHPLNRKPTCYDAEGMATLLPTVLKFGELLMKGVPMDQIKAEIAMDSGPENTYRRAGRELPTCFRPTYAITIHLRNRSNRFRRT